MGVNRPVLVTAVIPRTFSDKSVLKPDPRHLNLYGTDRRDQESTRARRLELSVVFATP